MRPKALLPMAIAILLLAAPQRAPGSIVEIIDATGDGTHPLSQPVDVAVGAAGDVYVVGVGSQNAFRIAPTHVIAQIIDAAGDGAGHPLTTPAGIGVDGANHVYVTGADSDNAFEIAPGGVITQIIDATGDGAGHALDGPVGVATDASNDVFITGSNSDNVFEITPGGVITQIIDGTGDGLGHALSRPNSVAVDGSGNVYVAGAVSNNAFKITPGGIITQIIDTSGDGAGNTLLGANRIAADAAGNVFVGGTGTDNAFRITAAGVVTEIVDFTGDGISQASELRDTYGIAAAGDGSAYVVSMSRDCMFKVVPGISITKIIDAAGDGSGNPLDQPMGVRAGPGGRVYVTGGLTDDVFLIGDPYPTLCPPTPASTCHVPVTAGKSTLQLKTSGAERNLLSWKWAAGDVTPADDFGTPVTTTDYALCLYDASGLLTTATVPAGGVCGNRLCWAAGGSTGFKYKDTAFTPDGIGQMVLRAGPTAGKAKVQVKGRGPSLPMPDLPIVNLPLTVQLHNGRGKCWQAIYTTPTKNDEQQFGAKGG